MVSKMENILLVGFGGHARSVADSIEQIGRYRIVGYTDIQEANTDNGYLYLGTDDELEGIYQAGTHQAVVAVGQIGTDDIRHKLYKKLKQIGYELPVITDPSAIIAKQVKIGEGTFVGKGAIINTNSQIGKMSIINSGVLCEHDNKIGDFCHLAIRSVCGGNVMIGNDSFIGANATIIQGINLGQEVVIGAGALVLHDVPDKEKRYGIV